VSQFKYLGTIITNQNLIQEGIKRRLNSGTACCHSAQNLLSSRLLLKNVKIRTCKTIILPLVLRARVCVFVRISMSDIMGGTMAECV
jgi:hypothetical protein